MDCHALKYPAPIPATSLPGHPVSPALPYQSSHPGPKAPLHVAQRCQLILGVTTGVTSALLRLLGLILFLLK